MRPRPLSIENPEYDRYVSLVPDGDIEEILSKQRTKTITFLSSISEETARKAYAPGKWTLKEVHWAYGRRGTCDVVSNACHCTK
ncbi:MAG: hypothetical protein ACQEXK_26875 [Bacillota bacterium]